MSKSAVDTNKNNNTSICCYKCTNKKGNNRKVTRIILCHYLHSNFTMITIMSYQVTINLITLEYLEMIQIISRQLPMTSNISCD